jgi:hypothetical protein
MSTINCEDVDKVIHIQILKHVFFLASNGLQLFPFALYLNESPVCLNFLSSSPLLPNYVIH